MSEKHTDTDSKENALLVHLRWRFLEGSKIDRERTADVAEETGAELQAVTVTKKLFPPNVLAELRSIKNESIKLTKLLTRPYNDQGGRILPCKAFSKFQKRLLTIQDRVEKAVRSIVDNYDMIKEESRIRLGKMSIDDEFPTKDAIREAFSVRVEYTPIPKKESIKLNFVSADEQEALKKELEATVSNRLAEAHKENYNRLLEVIQKMFDRLGNDPEGKPLVFSKSTVQNLVDELEVGKEMNFNDDEQLDQFIGNLSEELEIDDIDPQALRTDPRYRFGVRATLKNAVNDITEMGIL